MEIRQEALEKCFMHAKEHPHVEVAGVLTAREKDGGKILVVGSIPVSEGDPASVVLNPVKVAFISEKLRSDENYPVE